MTVLEKLTKKLKKVCKENEVPVPVLKLSSMKKANGTFSYSYKKYEMLSARTKQARLSAMISPTIKVSKYISEHFDYKTTEQTLLHEIAHYLDLVQTGSTGHGKSFKDICVALGGTMNQAMATGIYSNAASADFVSKKMFYMYKCSCGDGRQKAFRKLSAKHLSKYRCPTCRENMSIWTVTKEGM